ncbi:prenyltransferase/squalene oxidase repeat-containing protein [Thermococcus peptonophilus]|uniref:hypothetical protein n=1 Tax=Thermococcus peptonophilus TaxID=53952 RepID=UPI0012E823DA|nr:hypothetical protein [Thermococcus peptonophilus]
MVFIIFVTSALSPLVLADGWLQTGWVRHPIEKYQPRTLYSYPWDSTEGLSGWNAFRENESFYLTCLKVIALARSGYPRNSSKFRKLVEWIKSQQGEDGSFPAVITDDYPESDSEWFYWELSKAAGTGLAILTLLEAGESTTPER